MSNLDNNFEKSILVASIAHDLSIQIETDNMKQSDTFFIIKVPMHYTSEDAEYIREQFTAFFSCDVFVMYDDISIKEASIENLIAMKDEIDRIIREMQK